MTDLCPCGSNRTYATCCAPFHLGQALPTTAEQLMRSRYSAFAKRLPQYLFATLHPSKRAPDELAQLEAAVARHRWLGLQILNATDGGQEDDRGTVSFRAVYEDSGSPGVLEENSSFKKETGRWYYLSGQLAPTRAPGRNDPCWCGSGRKFKKCHG
ncbi:YchJ family protein [Ketobacter sp.]|uniref:YchJ family protein n=1 Tax=Ketobacter sp. TaxID=2083498 RepID=UPI000F250AA8|nr:YchJ family protein [Ketobacter sp.]RLT92552.1 MAG: YchJ family protein [Ketobacter sp.]